MSMSKTARTIEEYWAQCAACEIRRVFSAEEIVTLRSNLIYKDTAGGKGRCVAVSMPEFGLKINDRVEPTAKWPDIADIRPEQAPREILFWRAKEEQGVRHRCALLDPSTTLTLDSFGLGWLHVISLGIAPYLLGNLYQKILRSNAFNLYCLPSTQIEVGLAHLRSLLFAWYTSEEQQNRHHSRIQALTSGMLGDAATPKLKVGGAECNGMTRWTKEDLLNRVAHTDPAEHRAWKNAVDSLVEIIDLIHENRYVLSTEQINQFTSACKKHLRMVENLGLDMRPKHHFLMEMCTRCSVAS